MNETGQLSATNLGIENLSDKQITILRPFIDDVSDKKHKINFE